MSNGPSDEHRHRCGDDAIEFIIRVPHCSNIARFD